MRPTTVPSEPTVEIPIQVVLPSSDLDEITPTNSVAVISPCRQTLRPSHSNDSSVATLRSPFHVIEKGKVSTFQACRRATRKAWIAWIACDFAGVLLGYDCFYINGVLGMRQFKQDFGGFSTNPENVNGHLYTNLEKSVMVSIFALGVALGAPITGNLAENYGRRISILIGCSVHVVGIALQLIAGSPHSHVTNIALLSMGRLVGGVGLGMLSGAVVTYFNETAPKELRGALSSSYQVGLVCGICLSTCINLATKDLSNSGAYRISIGIQFLWVTLLTVGIYISPETPRWYVSKGRHDQAAIALSAFLGPDPTSSKVQGDLDKLIESYRNELSGDWIDCFDGGLARGSNLRRTMLGLLVQFGQQFTGINFMFYYGTTFFLQTNMPNPFALVIGITLVNAVFCLVSFWTIENIGRRPLLIWGAALMALFQLIALLGTVTDPMTTRYVIYLFICLFAATYASTWAPCAWAVTGDIFPAALRSKGIALGTTANWGLNFILTAITPYLVDSEYANLKERIFYIWFALCLICGLYSYFEVYETKGLELEVVDRMVKIDRVTPRQSAAWLRMQAINNFVDLESPAVLEHKLSLNIQAKRVSAASSSDGTSS
ncbi:hypothetical protein BJ878DRAFT_418617 [Calycina marina]|uniref:Major facilitator superfamily (MFS) profile domain-containing protein n=1 Tax=Calycina marina TaxID=1763456 RepID=A0A9P8CHQ1_9HELO|nr:hypothetical protein BJ878DRAFT_418617 [Calycina marina]